MALGKGLAGLLSFVDSLKEKGITYSIHHYSSDQLTVFFTLVGARVEVSFSEDNANYSVFKGNEDVETDSTALDRIIEQHWQ